MSELIDLRAPWKSAAGVKSSKGKQVAFIDADDLRLDLRAENLFELLAPKLVEHYKSAVAAAKGSPTKGTIARRGPGKLFKVSGEFVGGVEFGIAGRGKRAVLTLTTGRLSKTVPRWLQFRVPGVRARRLLTAARKHIQELVRDGVVKLKKKAA